LHWLTVDIDIDERKKAEEQSAILLMQLQKANAVKDEFLGLVSHELRTPITKIIGNAAILQKRLATFDDEDLTEGLNEIYRSGMRLKTLVENLLTLAREPNGQHDTEPMRVRQIVKKLIDEYQAEHPGRKIVLTMDDSNELVLGKPLYIEQVLLNLLTNADKYSSEDQPIDVSIEGAEAEIHVRVADRGQGVTKDELEAIFKPFYRSESTSSRPGLGIGLAVCYRLVEAMSGRIWAQTRPDGGTEFMVALPIAALE
jgi:two-component system sensor histidine kinase KdpD